MLGWCVALASLTALPAFAQMQVDVAAITSRTSLTAWQRMHPGKRLDGYGVDYPRANRWCAASVDQTRAGMSRTALFYVQSPVSAQPLPVKADIALVGACELDAIWYETQDRTIGEDIVHELTASWGHFNGAVGKPEVQGSGLWKGVAAWHITDTHRSGIDIWVANGQNGKLIVYARRNMPSDWDLDHWLGSVTESQSMVADAVAQIAALGPALTDPILRRSRCGGVPESPGREEIESLAKWLTAAQKLTPARRAASALLADFYITCAGTSSDSDPVQSRLIQLGAKYVTRNPEDGPDYAHNFREQAERLDSHGPAGELAGLVSLADPCLLKGTKLWPSLVIAKATTMLSAFPATQWTPYVHFLLARAHASELSLASPGGNPEELDISALSPALMRQDRSDAISHFRYFLKRRPGSPESTFAWQEAWRLLAGLPPSQIHFGCTGE